MKEVKTAQHSHDRWGATDCRDVILGKMRDVRKLQFQLISSFIILRIK